MMDVERLVHHLNNASEAHTWLRSLRLENPERAHTNLVNMTRSGMTLDLLCVVCDQLEQYLPQLSDPDMALNNLDRFVAAARNPLSLGSLFERDAQSLPTLLGIFTTSQYLADWLIRDPEAFDLLRLTEGQPVERDTLVNEIANDIAAAEDERVVKELLRRYKYRETLRIAYGDIIRGQSIGIVTSQISYLADALVEAALRFAWRALEAKRGVPRLADGQRARFVVLALGKLGGAELNYSSDIDLVFISDGNGSTDGERPTGNQEFFDRLAQRVVKLLTEQTDLGIVYRVDLRLRPMGQQGSAVNDMESALHYYDVSGRTWERQAFVKARPIAGDIDLGQHFLHQLEPWVYRRYLSFADITGIRALRHRIEQRARRTEGDSQNIKTGLGGIRDIEFVIQFLQLLNGGDVEEIRTGNTLRAISRLEQVGCLTMQERAVLEENYGFLRKVEHRLQIMFDLQTHTLPDDPRERQRLAVRTGYSDMPERTALKAFEQDMSAICSRNRKILDHLLHEAFDDDSDLAPETDLVLDPDPSREMIADCLGHYGFRDVFAAYDNLMALSTENISFLSTRRCRHFLAAIAPELIRRIAATPDPDFTLVNLVKVSDSLGGKGVLWELFRFNPPTLRLYVRLCASSSYLSGILTSNPGMIDELMDSLVLDRLPNSKLLVESLAELCRGAEDIEPILHSFKNFQHLCVGVRDILGKEQLRDTHRSLSDVAEVCLQQVARQQYKLMTRKFGFPSDEHGKPLTDDALTIVAMGKLGGREPNYHSDLDLIFLYEHDGRTVRPTPNHKKEVTSNQHFFSQLGQKIIRIVTRMGPHGRLFEIDPRLRPTGKSGALAVSLAEFQRYFSEGQGQLWERQALCKARAIFGSPAAKEHVMRTIHQIIVDHPWQPSYAAEIHAMRLRMEQTASDRNLKRGKGGTVDIEFLVQMLQLKHAASSPQVLVPGTLEAIDALRQIRALTAKDAQELRDSYCFLRGIESRLRLMNTTALHDLPTDELELKKLAFLLREDDPFVLQQRCRNYRRKNRETFDHWTQTEQRVDRSA
jgi:glutamate-ammonia-ligase adenylyltransferase